MGRISEQTFSALLAVLRQPSLVVVWALLFTIRREHAGKGRVAENIGCSRLWWDIQVIFGARSSIGAGQPRRGKWSRGIEPLITNFK
jgi:hypothetical protein